ncbi:hypothetical protein LFX15_05585 [Leptospira levettii]|uniref:hypothetical protein n=1 Tax=Leptospira levettii TaxID=2023178 RepID=UPI001EEA04DC|nr:hypothetical protein [Leptospira levettii]MCG6147750.1 hypothetical protein [Leptospira levettii]
MKDKQSSLVFLNVSFKKIPLSFNFIKKLNQIVFNGIFDQFYRKLRSDPPSSRLAFIDNLQTLKILGIDWESFSVLMIPNILFINLNEKHYY